MLFVKPQAHETWRARLARVEAASSPELRASAKRRGAIREKFR
jgi:hypothetical protein